MIYSDFLFQVLFINDKIRTQFYKKSSTRSKITYFIKTNSYTSFRKLQTVK